MKRFEFLEKRNIKIIKYLRSTASPHLSTFPAFRSRPWSSLAIEQRGFICRQGRSEQEQGWGVTGAGLSWSQADKCYKRLVQNEAESQNGSKDLTLTWVGLSRQTNLAMSGGEPKVFILNLMKRILISVPA